MQEISVNEQGNTRPILILSNDEFNARTELVIAALITWSGGDGPYRMSDKFSGYAEGIVGADKRLSKFRGNVRLIVQHKCPSLIPRWYQMLVPEE